MKVTFARRGNNGEVGIKPHFILLSCIFFAVSGIKLGFTHARQEKRKDPLFSSIIHCRGAVGMPTNCQRSRKVSSSNSGVQEISVGRD